MSSSGTSTGGAAHDPSREGSAATPNAARGGADYVAPADRIAVFDIDGTLWCEQPMYVQLAFALDRVNALASSHPEWQSAEPFASVVKGDVKAALASGERGITEIITVTHTGMTTDEFDRTVDDWVATARHAKSSIRRWSTSRCWSFWPTFARTV